MPAGATPLVPTGATAPSRAPSSGAGAASAAAAAAGAPSGAAAASVFPFEIPPSLEPAAYAQWIRADAAGRRARRMEEVLSTLTLVLPSLLGSAGEVVSEGMTALSGLLSMHHAVLLRGDPTLAAARRERARAAAAEAAGSRTARLPLAPETERMLQWALSVIGNVDAVVEIAVLRAAGPKARWVSVAGLETARAALKLALLWQGQHRRARGDADAPRHLINGGRVDFDPAQQPGAAAAAPAGSAPEPDTQRAALAAAWAAAAGRSSADAAEAAPPPATAAEADGAGEAARASAAAAAAGPGDAAAAPLSRLASAAEAGAETEAAGSASAAYWEGSRSGVRLCIPAGVGAEATASAEAEGAGRDLDAAAAPLRAAAEVAAILRPAVYAAGRAAMPGEGAAAPWLPWLASAALDAASFSLVAAAEHRASGVPASDARPPPSRTESALESVAAALGAWAAPAPARAGASAEDMLTLPPASLASVATGVSAAVAATGAAGGAAPPAPTPTSTSSTPAAAPAALSLPSAIARQLVFWFISGKGSRHSTLSTVEAGELSRRQWALLFYFTRDPIWSVLTKPALERILGPLESIPLLGMAIGPIRSMAEYYQSLHSQTAGAV